MDHPLVVTTRAVEMTDRVRRLAEDYLKRQQPRSAIFWAEKAMLLSENKLEDVILYCQTLYDCGEYRRGASLLQNNPLLHKSSALRYMAAKCLVACESWEETIFLLKPETEAELNHTLKFDEDEAEPDLTSKRLGNTKASSQILLGQAHKALGNIKEAINCYKEALNEDVYCAEALERIYELKALNLLEEQNLMASLPLRKHCSVEEEQLLRYLYHSKLHHHRMPKKDLPSKATLLGASVDVRAKKALSLLQEMKFEECLELVQSILKTDLYHGPTILIYIACCAAKKSIKLLYSLGHDLVTHFPDSPLAWYTVSVYYLTNGDHDQSRRYLSKALNLNPQFSLAHMAYGHSFAAEGQHDQAIPAFSYAARYMQGSHLPLLYLGKEYFHSGNLPISISFFKNALLLSTTDPLLLHEVATVMASTGNYSKAERYLKRSVALLQLADPHVTLPAWEPVYNNLGHILRKLGNYSEALEYHRKALQLSPREHTTLTAIAFVHLLMEDYPAVITYCNQSLRIKREDQFTIEVLQKAVSETGKTPYSDDADASLDVVMSSGESSMQTD